MARGTATGLRGFPKTGRGLTLGAGLALFACAVALAPAADSGPLRGAFGFEVARAAVTAPCGGAPMPEPDRVITGSFGRQIEGDYVLLPFRVPEGTTAIRVKYCHDQPLLANFPGVDSLNKHTLDMGVYGPREEGDELWDADEIRGWGGSSRKDVTISPEGSIDPDPAPVASEETTVGYRPGPIEPGRWAVELGVAAIGAELPALEDDRVGWRVEIDLIDDPSFADEPYEPVPYDERPANPNPGWYEGDFHVHARNSAPGDATMRETFDYAFGPPGQGADLDFITLSDYVNDRSWGEIGAFQADYPGKLIIRSSEVITYRGHINNHGGGEFVDYRTGAVIEATLEGAGVERRLAGLRMVRPPRPAAEVLRDIHAGGGWTQLNHVETFPAEVPTFGNLCRGCSWEYSPTETDFREVDAIEIATGPAGLDIGALDPGPNPFGPLALLFYERALDANGANRNRIAAVGSSDSHNAGRTNDPITQAPIGTARTVVYAEELSEDGIREGIERGHTYVKTWGGDGPDLRLEGMAAGMREPAIMGDTIPARTATLTARVSGLNRARTARGGIYALVVARNGLPHLAYPMLAGDRFQASFPAFAPGRYSLWVLRVGAGVSLEAVTTPIWMDPAGDPRG